MRCGQEVKGAVSGSDSAGQHEVGEVSGLGMCVGIGQLVEAGRTLST